MKLIDLFNNIANNKDVPKKIKYNGIVYEYYCSNYYLEGQSIIGLHSIFNDLSHTGTLNDEIEILDKIEDKPRKIKKIETTTVYCGFDNEEENIKKMFKLVHFNENKINEIIDKLNYLLEKSDKE